MPLKDAMLSDWIENSVAYGAFEGSNLLGFVEGFLETQSFNAAALSFYQKNGFEIIGFDRFAYSNEGPSEHNIRIEMGKNYSE